MHEDTEEMQYYGGKLNHLWVDLFTIDELPANKAASTWTLFLHTAIYGLAMGHRYKLDFGKYGVMGRICVWILSTVGRLIPMSVIRKLQHMAAVKDRKGKTPPALLQQLPAGLPVCDASEGVVRGDGGSAVRGHLAHGARRDGM